MNRFFRSALFPLFVIVLLVYLASQTLIPHSKSAKKVTYSDFIALVADAGKVGNVDVQPEQALDQLRHGTGDKKATVHYPADQSVPQITSALQKHRSIRRSTRRAPAASPGSGCSSRSCRS